MSVAVPAASDQRVVLPRIAVMAVLTLALTVATGASLLSGGWADSSAMALAVGAAGVVEGLILARSAAPRWVAALLAPPLLLASLVPATVGSRPALPRGVWAALGQYTSAALTGLFGDARWQFAVGLAALLWVCGAWAAWFAVREHRGAVATAPCWLVVAVNVINAPAAQSAAVPSTLAAVAALGLIATVHLARLTDGWSARNVRVLPGTNGRFGWAAATAALVVMVAALLVPPLTNTDISARIFNFGRGAGGGGGDKGSLPGGTVQFNPATVPGGALKLSNQPVLTYKLNIAPGAYLRMATDSVFDAGAWYPDTTGHNADIATADDPAGSIRRDRNPDDGTIGAHRESVTATVLISADNGGTNLMPFPGEPDSSSLPMIVTGLSPPGALGGLRTVDSVGSGAGPVEGTTFTVTGSLSTATADELRSAGTQYPDFVTREFMTLPDDGTTGQVSAIRALAQQWTANATNPYDAATAIENHLRNPQSFRYTLDPAVPAIQGNQTLWPVTYFLTQSHAGYCQYFASAMGTMLRSLQIPARLVNGYGPGSAPEQAGHNNNVLTQTVTSNDAHTWVEAYFPTYGWVDFEPTPPSQLGDYQPFTRGVAPTQPPPGATPPPSSAATPTPRPTSGATVPPPPSDTGGGSGVPAALADTTLGLLAAVVLLGLAVVWFLRPRTVAAVWRRVALFGRVVGVRRDGAQTYAEYAARLAAAVPPDGSSLLRRNHRRHGAAPLRRRVSAALAEIVDISDRASYAQEAAHPREVVRVRRAWWRVARIAPRIGWRVLLSRSPAP